MLSFALLVMLYTVARIVPNFDSSVVKHARQNFQNIATIGFLTTSELRHTVLTISY